MKTYLFKDAPKDGLVVAALVETGICFIQYIKAGAKGCDWVVPATGYGISPPPADTICCDSPSLAELMQKAHKVQLEWTRCRTSYGWFHQSGRYSIDEYSDDGIVDLFCANCPEVALATCTNLAEAKAACQRHAFAETLK